MARKSNKTAHVLNLLAGHDAQNTQEEPATTEESVSAALPAAETSSIDKNVSDSDSQPTPSSPENSQSNAPTPAQNISVIDTTGEDPLTELLYQELSNTFGKDLKEETKEETDAAISEALDEISTLEEPEPETLAPSGQTTSTKATFAPEPTPESKPDPVSGPESGIQFQPAPEPEPEFVYMNVMEEIVKDKIIYFMRQFDVCTCDRCKADTIALTMNGLIPKYIVTPTAAADPLLSYYTNRLISDVTVEATKACMIVKENPRH